MSTTYTTISSGTLYQDWPEDWGTSGTLGIFCTQSFTADDGRSFIAAAGDSLTGEFVTEAPITVASSTGTYAAYIIPTTDTSTPNTVRYFVRIFDQWGAYRADLFDQPRHLRSSLGSSITELQWANDNAQGPFRPQADTKPTTDEMNLAIAAAIGNAALNQDFVVTDYASFSAAIDAMPGTGATLVVNQASGVTVNKTVPSNVTLKFTGKGSLALSNGVTVTILGPIEAQASQIFSNALSGLGTISFAGNSVLGWVYVEWWGAVSGATAATTLAAFQAAVDTGKVALALGASYTLSDTLNFNNNTTQVGMLVGGGMGSTLITCIHPTNPAIKIGYAHSGEPSAVLREFHLRGAAGSTPSFVSDNYGLTLTGGSAFGISNLIIDSVSIDQFGDSGVRIIGPTGPVGLNNVVANDCGNFGIEVVADVDNNAPQNVSIYGGSIQGTCKGGIGIDGGGSSGLTGLSIDGPDIELGASQTKPCIYLRNVSGAHIRATCVSSVASLSVGDSNIYFDTEAVRNDLIAVLNNAAGGLNTVGGPELTDNIIIEGTPIPSKPIQMMVQRLCGGIYNTDDKNMLSFEYDDPTYVAGYIKNLNAAGASRFALGMKPGETTGLLFQYNPAALESLFFSRAASSTLRLRGSGADKGMTIESIGTCTADLALKVANTAKFTTAPKTGQTYSNAMTIDVTISNQVIAVVAGTSATSTWTPSAAGSAGDWLYLTTEADASGTVTVTFAATFHSSGTQATTGSHFSSIAFLSDGTRWIEQWRTTDLA